MAPAGARRRTEPVATVAPGASSIEREADEAVARVAALGHGGQRETRRGGRRQILGRVHGEVGAPVEHRLLHLLHEHTLAAERVDRADRAPRSPVVCTSTSSTSRSGTARRRAVRRRARPASGRGDLPAWSPAGVASRARPGLRAGRTGRGGPRRSRSPRGLPATSLRRTVGSCSSLATRPVVIASTASRSRSSRSSSRPAVPIELGLAHGLGPLVQRG